MSSGQTLGVPGNADRLVGSVYFLCGRASALISTKSRFRSFEISSNCEVSFQLKTAGASHFIDGYTIFGIDGSGIFWAGTAVKVCDIGTLGMP
jgi:hypothetical protein